MEGRDAIEARLKELVHGVGSGKRPLPVLN